MNGFLATVQQAADVLHAQAVALWGMIAAIAANRPEPARNVIVYTLVLIALLAVTPRIIKKLR